MGLGAQQTTHLNKTGQNPATSGHGFPMLSLLFLKAFRILIVGEDGDKLIKSLQRYSGSSHNTKFYEVWSPPRFFGRVVFLSLVKLL